MTPNSPARNGPGTVGLPVVVGGVTVGPGDIVHRRRGWRRGRAIRADRRRPSSAWPAVRAAEADLDAKVKAGLQIPAWIEKLIAAGKFQEVD